MSQTRLSSLIEAVINTALGYVISLLLTALVMPHYGVQLTFVQSLQIPAVFTVASMLRGYCLRRWFNARIQAAAQRLATKATAP